MNDDHAYFRNNQNKEINEVNDVAIDTVTDESSHIR